MKDNTLKNIIIYPIFFFVFCALNKVIEGVPLSLGAYLGMLSFGFGILPSTILVIISFVVFKNITLLVSGVIFSVFFAFVFWLYKRKKKKVGAEIVVYIFIGLLHYILQDFFNEAVKKLVYMSIIAILYLVSNSAYETIFYKRFSPNIIALEGFFLSVFVIIVGIGINNLQSINLYRPLAVLLFIMFSRFYKDNTCFVIGIILSIPAVITQNNLSYFSSFILFSTVYIILKDAPSVIISLALLMAELLNGLLFKFYGTYTYISAIPTLSIIFLTSLISSSYVETLRLKYNVDIKDSLTKSVIANHRTDISSKLYDVSNVFYQMQDAFCNLKKCADGTDNLVEKLTDQVIFNMCSSCAMLKRCNRRNVPKREVIQKIIGIGIAKTKISLIDLPKDFTEVCGYPNSVIYEVNRLIGQYCEYIRNAESGDRTKEILSLQSNGVAGVIKELGFSLSKNLKENKRLENKITKSLLQKGVRCEGVLVFGEDKDTEISIILNNKFFTDKDIAKILSEQLNIKLTVTRAEPVSNMLMALTIKIAPMFDAIFGVSKITKTQSEISGDCHTLVKVDESNFLVALSDGMGSGDMAEKTSSCALNLIESLYKAGLDTEFILNMVNKLLAISVDDNFTAIDIALVNLSNGDTGFVKIGSPYGFILSDNGIRFIEGSSLPLGILDDLHPTTAQVTLVNGDVIVLLSDGVSDAFGSSGELIDFLKSAPIHNPQELSDAIVTKALQLSGGVAHDDMSALCVRIVDQCNI